MLHWAQIYRQHNKYGNAFAAPPQGMAKLETFDSDTATTSVKWWYQMPDLRCHEFTTFVIWTLKHWKHHPCQIKTIFGHLYHISISSGRPMCSTSIYSKMRIQILYWHTHMNHIWMEPFTEWMTLVHQSFPVSYSGPSNERLGFIGMKSQRLLSLAGSIHRIVSDALAYFH